MSDSFTETTHRGWGSRLGESIKGILFGVLLFIVAFPVLVYNEGRAVRATKTNEEGAKVVVSLPDASKIDAGAEGKLVHLTGTAQTDETLSDPQFGVSVPAIHLLRKVEVFQWKEQKESKTEKNVGGSTDTKTTYTYTKGWDDDLADSSSFKHPEGHENPKTVLVKSASQQAKVVKVGAYTLSPNLVGQIKGSEPLVPDNSSVEKGAQQLGVPVQLSGEGYYIGKNPADPQVGDLRITFTCTKPGVVSVVARAAGGSLGAYTSKTGNTIEMLENGSLTAQQLFANAESRNTLLTWVLRLVGFFLMFIGISLVLRPLSVLGDVLPFIGSLLEMGLGLVAGLLSAVLSLITIAIAWIAYRPLLGVGILVAAGALMVFLFKRKKG